MKIQLGKGEFTRQEKEVGSKTWPRNEWALDNFHISMTSSPKAGELENEHRDCDEVLEARMLPCHCQGIVRITDSWNLFFGLSPMSLRCECCLVFVKECSGSLKLSCLVVDLLWDVRITLYGPQKVDKNPSLQGVSARFYVPSVRLHNFLLALCG